MSTAELEQRVVRYWTGRTHDFGSLRKSEISTSIGEAWRECLTENLPAKAKRILDVGTGTGFFCILLASRGYEVTGIDLTPSMIREAQEQAIQVGVKADFQVMDAQRLDFGRETFDAVISRNLTWTLPDAEQAYREWHRVLKPGGLLLNFDANYGMKLRESRPAGSLPYGHQGITKAMEKENDEITLAMDIARRDRPDWDGKVLRRIGFSQEAVDLHAGKKIMGRLDDAQAPLFMVRAVK